MAAAIFSRVGILFLVRWVHLIASILWMGDQYRLSFARKDSAQPIAIEPIVKMSAIASLVTGIIYIGISSSMSFHSFWGISVLTGSALGALMVMNLFSKSASLIDLNTTLFLPMIFFMASASHLGVSFEPGKSFLPFAIIAPVLVGALEIVALKGVLGSRLTPLISIGAGGVLSFVLYFLILL